MLAFAGQVWVVDTGEGDIVGPGGQAEFAQPLGVDHRRRRLALPASHGPHSRVIVEVHI
jgi:hypothetical protein